MLTNRYVPMNDTRNSDCAIDFDRLREITCGDEQLFAEISQQYLEQADQVMVELEAAIEDEDPVRVSQFAHKLGGSSATCGINAVVESLQSLENLQPYANSEAISLYQEIQHQLQRVRDTLSKGDPSND